jgi:hypothetical protein
MTENDWLRTNIRDRLVNPNTDFEVEYTPVDFVPVDFDIAAQIATQKIIQKYKNIYVPLSGGMDSEFVFLQLMAVAKPIIIVTPGNEYEVQYAFELCRKYKIEPIIIEKTEQEILQVFYNEIFKKLNGYGYNSVPALIAGQYAQSQNGIVVIGEHAFEGLNEWDFYNDALLDIDTVYYYMYTRQIVDSMIREFDPQKENSQQFKARMYKIPFRPKFKYKYSETFYSAIEAFRKTRKAAPSHGASVVF